MNTDKQISRGMERLMCRQAGARIEGMYGISGLGSADTFNALEGLMGEVGIPGARSHVKLLRSQHDCACQRLKKALPIAARATQLMTEAGPDGLQGIFSKIGKAIKKVAKVAVKLSPSHMLISKIPALKKISPAFRVAEGTTPLIAAAVGPPPPTDPAVVAQLASDRAAKKAAKSAAAKAKADAKAAAKKAKADAKAAAALAAAGAASTPMTPTEAGAAVLQQQSGVNLNTPAGQQFAQDTVANAAYPGSTIPDASLFNSAPAAADASATGLSPVVLIGGGIAALGLLMLVMKKKR